MPTLTSEKSDSLLKWMKEQTLTVVLISIIVFLVALMWTAFSASFISPQPPNFENLKKAIDDSFKCRDNPGMIVAIVKNGKTVFSEPFGVLLPGSKVKVTRDTKFMISSLTKGFTSLLLTNVLANNPRKKRLSEQLKLSINHTFVTDVHLLVTLHGNINFSYQLNTPIRDIIGDDFRFADEERTKYGSAEDLLSHRIGLPNKGFMRFNPSFNRSDFLTFARYWKTNLTFRGQTKYSSVTYTLAAAIAEHLGGKRWEDLVTERIFKPLNFTNTGFAFDTDFSANDVMKPYSIYKGRTGVIDPLFTRVWNSRCGSGCIISTVDDMIKWMNFLLYEGQNAAGEQVLPREEVEQLTSIRTYLKSHRRDVITKPIFPVTSVANEYCLAWRRGFYKGHNIISHTGSSPGFSSMIMLYPDEKMGIYVAMNGDDDFFYYRLALVHYIFDIMMGEPTWLNASTFCSFPEPWVPKRQRPLVPYEVGLKPALPYIKYMGSYNSPMYGEVVVNFNQSTSSLQGIYGVGSWQLFPQKSLNTFYGHGMRVTDFWSIPQWEFLTTERDPTNITRVVIHGFDMADPPVFEKKIE